MALAADKLKRVKMKTPPAVRQYLRKIGRKGGQSTSRAKLEALVENRKLAAKARRKYPPCERYHSHRFSPSTGRCPCGYVRPATNIKLDTRERLLLQPVVKMEKIWI